MDFHVIFITLSNRKLGYHTAVTLCRETSRNQTVCRRVEDKRRQDVLENKSLVIKRRHSRFHLQNGSWSPFRASATSKSHPQPAQPKTACCLSSNAMTLFFWNTRGKVMGNGDIVAYSMWGRNSMCLLADCTPVKVLQLNQEAAGSQWASVHGNQKQG